MRKSFAFACLIALFFVSLASAGLIGNTGDPYGWDASAKVMTNHDGLRFKLYSVDGVIEVNQSEVERSTLTGFALRGKRNGNWVTRYSTGFDWSWSVQQLGDDYRFVGDNNGNQLVWKQTWQFYGTPSEKMKLSHEITNDDAYDWTDVKMFYVQKVWVGDYVTFNNTRITVNASGYYWLTDDDVNLTAVLPQVNFSRKFFFNYEDVVGDGFVITDFFIGDASLLDLPVGGKVSVVGFTKGDSVLEQGETIFVDPTYVSGSESQYATFHTYGKKIVRTSDDTLHTVFLNTSSNALVYANSTDNGTSWLTSNLSNASFVGYSGFAVVAESDDDLAVAWVHENSSVYFQHGTYAAGAWTWLASPAILPVNCSTESYGSIYLLRLSMTVTTDDTLHLVCNKNNSRADLIYVKCNKDCDTVRANWNASDNSAAEETIEWGTGGGEGGGLYRYSPYPAVVEAASNDNIFVVFKNSTSVGHNLSVRVAEPNGDGTWTWLEGKAWWDANKDALGGGIAFDSSNTAYIAYAATGIHVKKCSGGCNESNNWNATNDTLGDDLIASGESESDPNSFGYSTNTAHFIWVANWTGADSYLRYRNYSSGSGWGANTLLLQSTPQTYSVQAARKTTGNTIDLLWVDGNFDVWYGPLGVPPAVPTVTLDSPADGANLTSSTINFSFTPSSTTTLVSATLYGNWSGGWGAKEVNQSTLVNGSSNTITETGVTSGYYVWNVYVCNAFFCAFAAANYSFNFSNGLLARTYDEQTGVLLTFNASVYNTSNSSVFTAVAVIDEYANNLPNGAVTIDVNATNYYPRTYYVTIATTTRVVLDMYLINMSNPSNIGVRFHVLRLAGTPVFEAQVTIQRSMAGGYVTVGQKLTGSDGVAFFIMDSNAQYQIIVSKAGFTTVTHVITPTSTDYTIYLTEGVTLGFQSVFNNVTYWFLPEYRALTDDTTFNFTTVASDNALSWTGMSVQYGNYTYLYWGQQNASPSGSTLTYFYALNGVYNGSFMVTGWFKHANFSEYTLTRNYSIYFFPTSNYSIIAVMAKVQSQTSTFTQGFIALLLSVLIIGAVAKYNTQLGSIVAIVVLGFFALLNWLPWEMFLVLIAMAVALIVVRRSG